MVKKILLGDEAIVKGALEAGVTFVSGYPGCPSAEIGQGFLDIAKENGLYAEWSTNEKVALESAIGASFSGLKSLVNMKSFGINVCSDSLLPLAYTGTRSPMVIVVADDPSCHSSAQSEQDSRGYAYLSHIPTLEPSDPQDCYEMTKLGFEISEKFNVPVILRITTRVAHQRAIVSFNKIEKNNRDFKLGNFVKNPHQFSTMPPRVLEMKKELLEKIEKIKLFAEKSKANKISGEKNKVGVIASGVSYFHVLEAIELLGANVPVFKLGFFYPLPEKKISDFLKSLKTVLVFEETDPYLEKEIKKIAKDNNLKLEIIGTSKIGETGELNAEKATVALAKALGKKIKLVGQKTSTLLKRTARLCEGCPYWNVFPVIKRVASEGTVIGGDIGCNMIAGLAPHSLHDYLFSMGASMGISHGVSKATDKVVISIMGDGTFFHAGMSALVNAVYNKSKILMVIVDNRITAMTGHQPNPGMGKNGMGEDAQELKIEEIAKSFGVKNIKVLDPIDMKELENTLKEFLQKEEVSVIVCRQICALLARRQASKI